MKTIGIPAGLFYYYYYPLWKTFFEDLGAAVVTSRPTSRLTVAQGIETAVEETCFPIKVYFGHVRELCDKNLDYIFLPRLISLEYRSYICPKFMGVPDMVRAVIADFPEIIDLTIDLSKNDHALKKDVERIGKMFVKKKTAIFEAYQHGLQELHFCKMIAGQGYTMKEAIDLWEGREISLQDNCDLNIGVLGHGYSLYDPVISMHLIERLRDLGCRVSLLEILDGGEVEKHAATLPKRVFWTLGRKMLGAALKLDQDHTIDGLIYLACFGCGPDSLVGEMISRKVQYKPFMMLTVDEHTGEAGLLTRLEAFCDMLRRRRGKQRESYFSAHG